MSSFRPPSPYRGVPDRPAISHRNSDPHPRVAKLSYSRKEAAEALGISLSSIDQLIHDEAIRTVPVGRRRLIPLTSLQEFLAAD